MKKNFLIVVCLVITTMLWANGSQEEESSSGKMGKHLTISFGYWDSEMEFNSETDELIQFVEEKFNITLETKLVSWADYTEKYRLWAAAGELPDFFATDLDKNTYQNWIQQGILRALPEDLSAYSELKALLARPDISYLAVDDQFYLIPRLHSKYPNVNRGVIVRKDWMEKLNIAVPETWEEFTAMARRFVNEDPDGNGKKDTVGVMVKRVNFYDTLLQNFIPSYYDWIEYKGNWIPRFMHEDMKKGIIKIGKLYKEKLLYEDFILLKEASPGIEKFTYGQSGILLSQCDPPRLQQLKDSWEQFNPEKPFEDSIMVLHTYPFPDDMGNRYNGASKAYWSNEYFSATVDDEKMARILEILNFLHTEEGYDLWYRGIEGKDYKKNGDAYEDLKPKDADGNPVALSEIHPSADLFAGMAYWGGDRTFFNTDEINYSIYDRDIVEMGLAYALALEETQNPDINFIISELGNDFIAANKIALSLGDNIEAAIIAPNTAQAWDDIIEKYTEMGIETIISEFNNDLMAKGLK